MDETSFFRATQAAHDESTSVQCVYFYFFSYCIQSDHFKAILLFTLNLHKFLKDLTNVHVNIDILNIQYLKHTK